MNADGGISPLANALAHRSEDVVSQQQLVIEATVAKSSSTEAAAVAGHGASNTNGNANCVSTCCTIKKCVRGHTVLYYTALHKD